MATFASIATPNDSLVRKAQTGAVFVLPFSSPTLTKSALFGTGGAIQALPTGWKDGGLMTEDGIRVTRSQETSEITAWQRTEAVRSDVTSDTETVQVDFLETNATTIGLYTGADLTNAYSGGVLELKKPSLPTRPFFRLLTMAVDTVNNKEFVIANYYPRCQVTEIADQAFSKEGGIQWGCTLTAYFDSAVGFSKDFFIGGPGFGDIATAMGFTSA